MQNEILITLGITILFLGTCITPSAAIDTVEQCSMPISSGNTLYVGGTGEGNYSSIQAAIDDASDGDTVFVYDDSSPYYENVVVDKSINLIGENRDTTIIDGIGIGDIIYISIDWIDISGFTIQNGSKSGLKVISNLNTIHDNNIILNNGNGIFLDEQCGYNNIIGNSISKNNIGISISFSYDNTIEFNNIENNKCGLSALAFGYCSNLIQKNNFIKNKRHAKFLSVSVRDTWDSNYWDNWIGVKVKLPFFQRLPKIIFGFFQIDFDWNPTKKPYII